MTPGPGALHRLIRQADSGSDALAALRVVRRLGVAALSAPVSEPAAADAAPAPPEEAGLRVVERLGVLAFARPDEAALPVAAFVAAVAVDVRLARRFGAGAAASAGRLDSVASDAAAAGLRVVRRLGADAAVSVADSGALTVTSSRGGASGARCEEGLAPTWARSIASSSGGTSLHGSLEDRDGAGRGRSSRPRSRPYERSSRGATGRAAVRPLTSG